MFENAFNFNLFQLGVTIFVKNNDKGLLKIIEEMRMGTREKNLNSLIDDFSTDVSMTLDTLYYSTIKFDAKLKKVLP